MANDMTANSIPTEHFEIVDAHQHTGDISDALPFHGAIAKNISVEEDVAIRLRAMNALAIDWTILQPPHAYECWDGIQATMRINDTMARYREADPAKFRLIAGTIEPMHGERSLVELDRVKYELKLDAVSWHHRFQGCFIDSRWMFPILRKMSDLNLVPIVHVNAESTIEAHWRLQRLAKEFPDLTFLAFDGLWSSNLSQQILESAMETPNIIWDFGGPTRVKVQQWVQRNGSTNICFSADIPYGASHTIKEPHLRKEIESANIAWEDKANIFGRNIRRAFGMPV